VVRTADWRMRGAYWRAVRTADWRMRGATGLLTCVLILTRTNTAWRLAVSVVLCLRILVRIVLVYFVFLGLPYSGR